jgi:hypothetical protein
VTGAIDVRRVPTVAYVEGIGGKALLLVEISATTLGALKNQLKIEN